jgi:hypothetical protein
MINDSFDPRHAGDMLLKNSFAGERNHLLSQNMIQQSSEFRHDEEAAGGVAAGIYKWVWVRSTRALRCSSSKADERRKNI